MAEQGGISNDLLFQLFGELKVDLKADLANRIGDLANRMQEGQSASRHDQKRDSDLVQGAMKEMGNRFERLETKIDDDVLNRLGAAEIKIAVLDKEKFDPTKFVSKDEFYPIRRNHYLVNGLIVTILLGALLALLFVKNGGVPGR